MRSALMVLAVTGRQLNQVSQTFTSSQTVVIPAGVSNLVTANGKGAAGTAAYDDTSTTTTTVRKYDKYSYSRQQRRSDGGYDTGDLYYESTGTVTGSDPVDFCLAPTSTPSDPTYSNYTTCYYYYCYNDTVTTTTGGPHAATTGASATGFGKTFPGGAGGAATLTNFNNVAVTGGSSYSLVIPSGGSINIIYFN